MQTKLDRIKEIGFTCAGCWKQSENKLVLELPKFASARNVLYCFVVDDELMYVGKTILPLRQRMQRYKTPARSQANGGTTNINNNRNIQECLKQGKRVEIFVLPDNGLLRYGIFYVNLAAGLEDNVVKQLEPPWNGGRKESPQQSLVPTVDDTPSAPR